LLLQKQFPNHEWNQWLKECHGDLSETQKNKLQQAIASTFAPLPNQQQPQPQPPTLPTNQRAQFNFDWLENDKSQRSLLDLCSKLFSAVAATATVDEQQPPVIANIHLMALNFIKLVSQVSLTVVQVQKKLITTAPSFFLSPRFIHSSDTFSIDVLVLDERLIFIITIHKCYKISFGNVHLTKHVTDGFARWISGVCRRN
jgi:hypothetical protein